MKRMALATLLLLIIMIAWWLYLFNEQSNESTISSEIEITYKSDSDSETSSQGIKLISVDKNSEMVSPVLQPINPDKNVISNQENCLSPEEMFQEFDNRIDYEESYGSYDRKKYSDSMPEYWNYPIEDLLQMADTDDSTAKLFAGIKLMYQSAKLENDYDIFDALMAIEKDGIWRLEIIGANSNPIILQQYDAETMNKARELLYDSALDGKIKAMFWLLASYDIEKAYLLNNGEWNENKDKEHFKKRHVDYALLIEPFDTKFGTLDLRPHHLKDLPLSIKTEIDNAITEFNEKRNLKGYAPLQLKGYPKDWAEREHCK